MIIRDIVLNRGGQNFCKNVFSYKIPVKNENAIFQENNYTILKIYIKIFLWKINELNKLKLKICFDSVNEENIEKYVTFILSDF